MVAADDAPRADLIVYADYVCPYSYLAEVAVAPLRAEGVRVAERALELRPPPVRLPAGAPIGAAEWEREVSPLARELGVTGMEPPRLATRSRKAHEAAAFAREHGAGQAMHAALFHAYFVEGRDIGRIDVLVEIGADTGLDRLALRIALDVDKYTAQVVAQQAEAARRGITAVPTHLVSGADGTLLMMKGVRATEELRALLAAGSTSRMDGENG